MHLSKEHTIDWGYWSDVNTAVRSALRRGGGTCKRFNSCNLRLDFPRWTRDLYLCTYGFAPYRSVILPDGTTFTCGSVSFRLAADDELALLHQRCDLPPHLPLKRTQEASSEDEQGRYTMSVGHFTHAWFEEGRRMSCQEVAETLSKQIETLPEDAPLVKEGYVVWDRAVPVVTTSWRSYPGDVGGRYPLLTTSELADSERGEQYASILALANEAYRVRYPPRDDAGRREAPFFSSRWGVNY
jgi:hypothetical protein